MTPIEWVLPLPEAGAKKAILLALAAGADASGVNCIKQAELAVHAGITERAVRSILPALESSGLIIRTGRTITLMMAKQERGSCPTEKQEPRSYSSDKKQERGAGFREKQEPRSGAHHPVGSALASSLPSPPITPLTIPPTLPPPNRETRARDASDLFGSSPVVQAQPMPEATKPAKRTGVRSQVPEDWWPDQKGIAFAAERGIGSSHLRTEVDRFISNHRGKGNVMADWPHAWRTWCMNHLRFSAGAPRPQTKSVNRRVESMAAILGVPAARAGPDEGDFLTIDAEPDPEAWRSIL